MPTQTDLRLSRYAPRTRMAPHAHDTPSLNIIIDGDFTEQIGRSERAYARGTVTFCPAGMVHAQIFGAVGAQQIIVRPQEAWLDYLGDCRVNLAASPHASSLLLQRLGERLLQEMRGDAFCALAREGILLEIVAELGRNAAAARAAAVPPAWLMRARDFIHEHALTPLTMARVAQAAGRHQIHLAREFRRHFGMSVCGYVRELRTEHAALLLKQSRQGIAEIALACGFSSHAHLCRELKARYGLTPSQYRAREA